MSYIPLTLSRRHVLGDMYGRCERATSIPVYLNSTTGERLGFVDESLGKYADAFTFHIPEEFCKKLGAGHFTYSLDYDFADGRKSDPGPAKRMVRLNSIVLIMRKGYDKPAPKKPVAAAAAADQASVAADASEAVT